MEELKKRKINYTVCLIRIIACLMIVWNHTSNDMLNGWGNPILWANIGVQIFFFMSGWLYSDKEIRNPRKWMKDRFLKICIPYWIYLIFIVPVLAILSSNLTWKKAISALICLQGITGSVEGIGQHWFITYILICYIITAFGVCLSSNNRVKSFFNRHINSTRGGVLDNFWNYLYNRSAPYNPICLIFSI